MSVLRPSLLLVAASAALLSGCVRFGAKPPPTLLSVQASSTIQPGATAREGAGTMTVLDLGQARAIATVRVAVKTSAGSYAYVKKGIWVDQPRNLFREMLAETIAARNNVLVLDPGQSTGAPGIRLSGDLMEFGIDEAKQQAVVVFDAVLADKDGNLAKRRFTGMAPVSRIEAGNVVGPIGAAANDVAAQIADWVKSGGQ